MMNKIISKQNGYHSIALQLQRYRLFAYPFVRQNGLQSHEIGLHVSQMEST